MTSGPAPRVVRFGVYEVDLDSGELRRKGVRLRLQEQPYQVLTLLLERPGRLLTRDRRAVPTYERLGVEYELIA